MNKHMEKTIHLAIVDDHRIFRDGMRMAMKDREMIIIDWEAENGKEMIEKLKLKKPDVLILDIKMPETDGIKALQLIRKEYEDVKIIILSMYDDKETIAKMMEYGANAYLTKTTDADEIYRAIISCMKDDFYFNDLVNAAVLLKLQNNKSLKRFYPNRVKFNENEMKILKLISEDKTTDEISDEIFLSPRTVESIRQNMKTKVGAKTIAGLLMYAIRNKLID
jgi:DNA-binding NarL/FixJ family response regulator